MKNTEINIREALQKERLLKFIAGLTILASLVYIVLYMLFSHKLAILFTIPFIVSYAISFVFIKHNHLTFTL